MNKYWWKIACTGMVFLGVLLGSCKNDDFRVGSYLIDPYTTTGVIDTVTIKVSNLAASDSVVTLGRSGREVGFSGVYYDPQIGMSQAQSYIEFSRTTDSETDRYARFDSVTLVLRHNGNYFGDTVKRAAFKVHRLTKPIERQDDGNLYSNSNTWPLGVQLADTTVRVSVRDTSRNIFEIRLPNSFGRWLFQGILRDDDAFKSDEYQKTFPGLSVGPGITSNCIHGLNLTDSACMIRIYYNVSGTYKQEKMMNFKVNPYNSFYNLSNDKSKLPYYNSNSSPVSSSQTNNKGIIMSGATPLYTRLEFPHLNELLWLGQIVKIKKATLYVRPIQRSFDTIPLPPKLNLYYFDPTSNRPLGEAIKPPSSDNTNTPPLDGNLPEKYQNIQSPNFPQYTFDVTNFIDEQLDKAGHNKWALGLIIPENARETTLQRLVFGDQNYWYKNENQSRDNRIQLVVIYQAYNE
jgi:hypothetical protein